MNSVDCFDSVFVFLMASEPVCTGVDPVCHVWTGQLKLISSLFPHFAFDPGGFRWLCVPCWLSYWWEIISRTTSLTMNEQEVERRRSWRLILWQQVAAGMKWTETPSGLWLTCVSVQDKWAAPRSLTPLTLPRMGGGAANAVVKKYHKLDNSTASITIFNRVLIRC